MINNVVLVGRLTKDPEVNKTTIGKAVCSFTIACNKQYADGADFVNCVAWNQPAEFLGNYMNKGSLIAVEGSIQSRSYDDKDGKKVYVQEVNVRNIKSLEPKKDNVNEDNQEEKQFNILSDDLPF